MNCVAETIRPSRIDVETWYEIWHLTDPETSTEDFASIVCSTNDEGITLPGPTIDRDPTCPDCLATLETAT